MCARMGYPSVVFDDLAEFISSSLSRRQDDDWILPTVDVQQRSLGVHNVLVVYRTLYGLIKGHGPPRQGSYPGPGPGEPGDDTDDAAQLVP